MVPLSSAEAFSGIGRIMRDIKSGGGGGIMRDTKSGGREVGKQLKFKC